MRSLRRLGEGEEAVERLTNASHKTPVRVTAPPVRAWTASSGAKSGARPNPRAVAAQFRRTDRPTRYATRPVAGLTYGSHPYGKYDLEHHNAANMERGAVLHALHGLGIVPPIRRGQNPQEHLSHAEKILDRYRTLAQRHIEENPSDPLTSFYRAALSQYAQPGSASRTAGAMVGAANRGARHEMNVVGLSAGVKPLLKKLAYERGELPYEHVPEGMAPRPPLGPDSLLEPEANYGPSDTGHTADEFRIPSGFVDLASHPGPGAAPGRVTPASETEGDNGTDLRLQTPSRRVVRNPALPPAERGKVYTAIANHLANAKPGGPTVPQMLQERHGFTPEQANRHYTNFLKLRTRPTGTRSAPPPMTPKGGRVTRRKFARAPAEGVNGFASGANGEFGGDAANSVTHGAFADFLDDHDDPRAAVVRRSNQYAAHPSGYGQAMLTHRLQLARESMASRAPLGDPVQLQTGDETRHQYRPLYSGRLNTVPPVGYLHAIFASQADHDNHQAAHSGFLTPEEHARVLTEFPVQHEPGAEPPHRMSRRKFAAAWRAPAGGMLEAHPLPNIEGEPSVSVYLERGGGQFATNEQGYFMTHASTKPVTNPPTRRRGSKPADTGPPSPAPRGGTVPATQGETLPQTQGSPAIRSGRTAPLPSRATRLAAIRAKWRKLNTL